MLRTPSGVQISRTFATRRAAKTFEATEKADRARGGWIDPRTASTTFAEVADQWLETEEGVQLSGGEGDVRPVEGGDDLDPGGFEAGSGQDHDEREARASTGMSWRRIRGI